MPVVYNRPSRILYSTETLEMSSDSDSFIDNGDDYPSDDADFTPHYNKTDDWKSEELLS